MQFVVELFGALNVSPSFYIGELYQYSATKKKKRLTLPIGLVHKVHLLCEKETTSCVRCAFSFFFFFFVISLSQSIIFSLLLSLPRTVKWRKKKCFKQYSKILYFHANGLQRSLHFTFDGDLWQRVRCLKSHWCV